jgi:hypothetical protein
MKSVPDEALHSFRKTISERSESSPTGLPGENSAKALLYN